MYYRFYLFTSLDAPLAPLSEHLKEIIEHFQVFHHIQNTQSAQHLLFYGYKSDIDDIILSQLEQALHILYLDTNQYIRCCVSHFVAQTVPPESNLAYPSSISHYSDQTFHTHIVHHSQYLLALPTLNTPNFWTEHTRLTLLSQDHLKLLRTLISFNQSITSACQILFLHRNTITYQLQKIMSLTGLSIHTTYDLLLIHTYLCTVHIANTSPLR